MVNVVHDDIFAQVARFGKKYPPAVQARHPIDEQVENVMAGQHECVDDNAGAGAVIHFSKRYIDAALGGRQVKDYLPVFNMGRGLPV